MPPLEFLSKGIYEAGFDAFAVMPAAPLEYMRAILRQAQRENRYPDFTDPDINKRTEPRALLNSALSVISLAVAYRTVEPGPTPPLHGSVSRSAWGIDYHRILNRRLDHLIVFLQKHFQVTEWAKAVDTSFLVDRALAVQAGLGYPGANCAVYVPPYGSWVFLGALLVNVELPRTEKKTENNWLQPIHCEGCVRACPTGALYAPGKIRPRRCISYLTQMSGEIPLEFREKIGTKLWGCDICQEASPVNKRAQLSRHKEFLPLSGTSLPLLPLLKMTNRQFKKEYGLTSMAWRGKNILQRNACIVLGNQGNPEAIPALKQTVENHPSPVVREAAAWALERIIL
ncbi:MAG: tRNA epoxyqueuosine(34) reductase QueG [Firmicutes bacterium]|nr:tRNA epoxyqueuosine(34) reductase QueG [Bacillota bacterium]